LKTLDWVGRDFQGKTLYFTKSIYKITAVKHCITLVLAAGTDT
jgi:hypothetical protein